MIDEKLVNYIIDEVNKSHATHGMSKENYAICGDPNADLPKKSSILTTELGYVALYGMRDDELHSGFGMHLFSLVCNALLCLSVLPPASKKLFYDGIEFRKNYDSLHGNKNND